MKVKICGVCRAQDAQAAALAGADFVGVILAPHYTRSQSAVDAEAIYRGAPSVERVGVFSNQTVQEIASLADQLKLNVIQLHGDETPEFVSDIAFRTGCAVWKSVWLKARRDLDANIQQFGSVANGLLFDAAHGVRRGGTGDVFDWHLAADARALAPADVTVIVAGGLTPDNVRDAIVLLKPDIVDVASGVEQSVGIKSPERIAAFVRNARSR